MLSIFVLCISDEKVVVLSIFVLCISDEKVVVLSIFVLCISDEKVVACKNNWACFDEVALPSFTYQSGKNPTNLLLRSWSPVNPENVTILPPALDKCIGVLSRGISCPQKRCVSFLHP